VTSYRARRMSERRLESEDIDPSLYRVRLMAVPQLVWVNVETRCSSPLSAYTPNRLSSEMSLAAGGFQSAGLPAAEEGLGPDQRRHR